jgi:thiol-disulfide isomerase/thioredoxin
MKRLLIILLVYLSGWAPLQAQEEKLELQDGTEIPYVDMQANSTEVYLLLPVEFGSHDANLKLGKAMQAAGLHTWVVDLFSPSFLPISTSSMDEIPSQHLKALIDHTQKINNKPTIIVASGRGAIPALRGGREWLFEPQQNKQLKGLILLHPKLYTDTPSPGAQPEYMPVALANQLPVYMLIPTQSPSRWRVDEDALALSKQGSNVLYKLLPGVRNFFFRNPHPNDVEAQMTELLPKTLQQGARILNSMQRPQVSQIAALPEAQKPSKATIRGIEPYKGTPQAPSLEFSDTNGKKHRLTDYKGHVVLLNFWATWCPPCVHEMPSMDRLQQSLQDKPFTILAVNMAEEEEVVKTFLNRDVSVSFPVLLDTQGLALKDWDVFVYPTTYIIDKQGRIRSAMYGAIDWDTDKIRSQLRQILDE